MSWHLHVAVHGRRDILHLQLILVHCLVQARKMRSAHASGPEGRDLRTDTKSVFKPPSHGLRWRGLWVLQMTLLPNCCLTVGLFDVKRECIICRGQNLWHKVCALRLMLTVFHFCTLHFANEEFCISGRSHFLGNFSRPYC